MALLLALASASAAPQWTALGSGDYIHQPYADKSSVTRNGAMARMSGMYDFRRQDFTPAGRALLSTVVLREYDCDRRRVRLLSSIDFAGRMGTGEVVDTSARAGRWEGVVEGSLDEAFWNLACGRD